MSHYSTSHPPLVLEFARTPSATAEFTAAYVGPPGPTTWAGITDKPTLGTASPLNVAATGNAAAGEVVKGDDTRLSDSRTPTGGAGGVLSGSYPNPDFAVDMATQAELDAVNAAKVDKVAGKGLSTEDYTTAEKNKLAAIASGATANATDAQLRDRATHTGSQAISTVTGLQGALDAKEAAGTAAAAVSTHAAAADPHPQYTTAAEAAAAAPVQSVAGKTGAVTLAKADVGLSNVDNTSDANKPISTATQAALDATVKRLDVGASPAQVPAGQHLGRLAYMDELAALRATLTQPQAIGAVWVERVSDTSIKLFMRGNDGVARSTTLTLS